MLKVKLLKDNIDFLDSLPSKQFKQIVSKIFDLCKDPYPQDSRKLIGYEFYRADIGEYRIVYIVEKEELNIILIGNRNDDEVYKILKRKNK